MKPEIENICPDFFSFWERARGLDLADKKGLWHEMYEDRHKQIFDIYYRHWGDPARLEGALARFAEAIPCLRECLEGLEDRISAIVERCGPVFSVSGNPLSFVIMIGCFTSDGWTTEYQGRPTIFFALEHAAGPRALDLLIAHESAHGFHFSCVQEDWWTDYDIGQSLFLEGLAVLASTELCPGWDEAKYLTLGRSGGQAWLAACRGGWPDLRRRITDDLSKVDHELYRTCFGASPARPGLPSRFGYYVGYRALAKLQREHTIAEMTRWPPDRASAEIAAALEAMDD